MTRRYDSAVRVEAKARTRQAIVDAMVAQLADGRDELALAEVAARAGVSLRTVQLHFPDIASREDAVADAIESRVGRPPVPTTVEGLLAYARATYAVATRDLGVMRASAGAGVAAAIRRRRKAERQRGIAGVVAGLTDDPEARRMVTALTRHLISAQCGLALLDEHGLEPERSGEVIAWTLGLVCDALARGDRPTRAAPLPGARRRAAPRR
ncbi:MAG: hypothetical protein IT385_25010 [Deltaproteobacteria bacterium]|nr:hypothetical protein [Deltaproteobacteria bacterium]